MEWETCYWYKIAIKFSFHLAKEVAKVFYLIFFVFLAICVILSFALDKKITKKQVEQESIKEKELKESGYINPVFKKLTQEEIDNIHPRGKITPAEKVKEWEGMDLCAPGDAIGSATWRCRKFHHNCHDCLSRILIIMRGI